MSHISQLQVSLSSDEETKLLTEGFISVPGDLNKGTDGNNIHLWYRRGTGPSITRIQFSFIEEMTQGLKSAGYEVIKKNLNEGRTADEIFLWYFTGSKKYDVPIVDLHVTTYADDEAEMFGLGWERLACDLTRNADGNRVYLWVKREKPTYICNITANANYEGDADLFKNGNIRVDENTNRDAGGDDVFFWYLQTTDPEEAIKDLQVSTTRVANYTKVDQNLNKGTGGPPVHLWYSKTSKSPIKAFSVIVNPEAVVKEYKKAGILVIDENLNVGTNDVAEFVCFYQ